MMKNIFFKKKIVIKYFFFFETVMNYLYGS